jgi:capsular exopolysaccharide synthesis family protein
LIDISRQQTIKNDIYSFLLQKREETELSYASAVADSRVIESAIANRSPIKPKANIIYLIGLVSGIGLIIIFLLIIEVFSDKIMFRKEIERKISAPIVGELIFGTDKKNLVVQEGNRSILAEQFRMLRTNMSFFGVGTQNKVIQVCSSISGEGKSYVASNLAIAFSLTGKKVLLLELDLRNPKLGRYFSLASKKGLTDCLIKAQSLEEIIQTSPSNPNLHIIASGSIPPNPTELIGSEAFADFMEEIKSQYDYIIVDNSPLSLVTDAQVFAPFSDSTLFVIRHAYTAKRYLSFIEQQVGKKQFKSVSIVFNGLKPRGFQGYGYGNAYSYGYGYGHGYGYGYGSNDKGKKKPWFKKIFNS